MAQIDSLGKKLEEQLMRKNAGATGDWSNSPALSMGAPQAMADDTLPLPRAPDEPPNDPSPQQALPDPAAVSSTMVTGMGALPPDQQDLVKRLQKLHETSLKKEESDLGTQRQLAVARLQNTPVQTSVAPLMAYADSLTGKNLAKSYAAPDNSGGASDADMAGIRKEQNVVTDNYHNYLKEMLNQKLMGTNATALRQSAMDQRMHTNVVNALKNDKQLGETQGGLNQLGRSLAEVQHVQFITPQQLQTVQQSIRNLAVKGTSGVAERSEAYYHTTANDFKELLGRYSGDPSKASIPLNDPLLQHVLDIAKQANTNLANQFNNRLKTASGGADNSLYNRRPDLKMDRDAVVESLKAGVVDPFANQKVAQGAAPVRNLNPNIPGERMQPSVAAPKMSEDEFMKRYLELKAQGKRDPNAQ